MAPLRYTFIQPISSHQYLGKQFYYQDEYLRQDIDKLGSFKAEVVECTDLQVFYEEIESISSFENKKGELWFRQEAMILHICCRTVDSAKKLLNFVRSLNSQGWNKMLVYPGFFIQDIVEGFINFCDDSLIMSEMCLFKNDSIKL